MKSQLPKVLHRIGGLTIIERVIRTAAALMPASITLVVGHGADEVKQSLAKRHQLQFVTQEQQLGTGHALLQARPLLEGKTGSVVLLSGDAPLLSVNSLNSLLAAHVETKAAATVITAVLPRPFGYGRIVRTNGAISKIVEEKDASPTQKAIAEINSGIYAFELASLFAALDGIGTANKQGEYYLPDLVSIYRKQKRTVTTWTVERADEIRGINSRTELAEVSSMVRQQKNEELMAAGVTLIDPATTYFDADVVVGADTVIYPCVFLEGSTKIGAACEIQSGARIVNSTIGDRVCIRNHTVVTDSTVESGSFVGPFAHIRPGSEVGEDAQVASRLYLVEVVWILDAEIQTVQNLAGERRLLGGGHVRQQRLDVITGQPDRDKIVVVNGGKADRLALAG